MKFPPSKFDTLGASLGVKITDAEQQEAVDFLQAQTEHFQKHKTADDKTPPQEQALAIFCQALFSTNRFLYVD